jgi:hypothetical protein
MPGLDFGEVKRMVTMRDLLDHYHISMRCPNPARPEQLKGTCPLPTHNHDTKESFNANLEKNCWSCWSTGCLDNRHGKDGSALDFVVFMEGCSLHEAAKKIVEWFGSKPTSEIVTKPAANVNYPTKPQTPSPEEQTSRRIPVWKKGPSEKISERPCAGGQPVPPDTTAQAEPVKPRFMQEIDTWFDDLVKRGDESDDEYWRRIRNGVKSKLIENFKSARKEVGRAS